MTLTEWISSCAGRFVLIEHSNLIEKHGELTVIQEFDGRSKAFPQKHGIYRNVYNWVLLSDGSAVGWNESERTGWNFIRIGKKTVNEIYPGLYSPLP